MSDVLRILLAGYFRARSNADGYRFDDPGRPLTEEELDKIVGGLANVQRQTLDDGALERLIPEFDLALEGAYRRSTLAAKSQAVKDVKSLDPAARGATLASWAILRGLLGQQRKFIHYNDVNSRVQNWLRKAMKVLGGLRYTLSHDQIRAVIEANRSIHSDDITEFSFDSLDIALRAIESQRSELVFTDDDLSTFGQVIASMSKYPYQAETRRLIAMLKEIVAGDTVPAVLWEGEPWAKRINDSIAAMPRGDQKRCADILSYAGTCSMSKPSKDWIKEAAALLAGLPPEAFETQWASWTGFFLSEARSGAPEQPAGAFCKETYTAWHAAEGLYLANTAHFVGLTWLTLACWRPRFAPLLSDLAESIARLKQRPREASANIGTAAVRVLGARDEDESLAQLSRLELRIRWPKLKKVVKKQLEETIKRRGLDRAEVEETLVPDFGLREGVAVLPFSGAEAHIALGRSDKPAVSWKLEDGKIARSLPAKLKTTNPDAAEQVKQTVGDIEKMRAAQRTRLDLLLRRPRTWSADSWRQRYLDHGLTGSLARRLIWIVNDIPVIWRDGSLVDVEGTAVTIADDATVRLWHPAERATDEVIAWREATEAWEIVQPFKQAYREIYLLTDAERRTNTYSNRFAAHIVRSMTLLSISQVRQWKSGMYGGESSPSFELSDFGLRAEWWMQAVGNQHTPYGAPIYLATDQVRFLCTSDESVRRYQHAGGTTQPLPLERVPALALTEILRDVDLFVSLASVGNDPEWQDGGPQGRYRDYWDRMSFGDLNESAKTRRVVLERLVPRLAIRDRARLNDKFLHVRGDVRSYKIHLGSGNILMEPNDQYLCIVPDSSSRQDTNVLLPFEGDATLSIILSKAFLLAADTKITDPTITRQIRMQ